MKFLSLIENEKQFLEKGNDSNLTTVTKPPGRQKQNKNLWVLIFSYICSISNCLCNIFTRISKRHLDINMSKTEFLIPLIPAHSSFSSSVLHVFNKWHYHLPQFSDQKSMYHYSIYNFMVFASFGKFFTSIFSNMALAPFSFPSLWDSKINMLTLSTRFHISLTHFPYFCFFMLHFS